MFLRLGPMLDAADIEGASGAEVLGEGELFADSNEFGWPMVKLGLDNVLRDKVFLLATISHKSQQMRPRAILLAGQGFQKTNMFEPFLQHPLLPLASQVTSTDFLSQSKHSAFFGSSSNIQTSVFLFHAIQFHQFKFREDDLLLGHSLGQIAALYLAKAISFSHALTLVKFRGRLVQEVFQNVPVGMFVTRSSPDSLPSNIFLACDNSSTQRVYAGTISALKDWSKTGVRGTLINMRGVFHCPLLQQALPAYREFIKNQIQILEPQFQVLSTVDCKVSKKEEIADKLCRQLIQPVRFRECAQLIKDKELIQFGTTVLSKLVKNS